MIKYDYMSWVVEGSNGKRLHGPCTFEDANKYVIIHEEYINTPYSASHPMPNDMVKGWENAKLGYLIRRVRMQAVEVVV